MKRTLMTILFVTSVLFPLQSKAANMDEPQFNAVNAVYTNTKHALLSTTLLGIQTFARRAMEAAMALQAQAMQVGDDTLANFAQGAYNYSKRASMSLTVEQARDYSEQAVSFAGKARSLMNARADEEDDSLSRRNLNNDQPDVARETYYQLRPEGEEMRRSKYEYR